MNKPVNKKTVIDFWVLYDPSSRLFYVSSYYVYPTHGINMSERVGEGIGTFDSRENAVEHRRGLVQDADVLGAKDAAMVKRLQPVRIKKTVTIKYETTIHWIKDNE